ncbi:Aste57867_18625 [Aphanomyces stellatus]|uniref:Aste57867_18625 protein n=1 Tax=Aphanomyces stellatus TaxID=120398 RepID=A0A485LEE9_9STRA|nr:hypothetical protein As57867_018563 [Aphanomyces stellatus]VFT95360.1 Aste57867_18625 [Aphanomyces stellatus]
MKTGLVLGLDGAGKTMLLRQLSRVCKDDQHPKLGSVFATLRSRLFATEAKVSDTEAPPEYATVPTTGVEEETLTYHNLTFTLREVGAPMLSMWKSYFSASDFFIFVVDATNLPQLAAAAIEFFNVLQAPPMQSKPGFLLLNKMDMPCTVSTPWLRSLFCLDQLCATTNLQVIQVSAVSGLHLDSLLQALTTKLSPPRYSHRLSALRDPSTNRIHPTTTAPSHA